MKATLIALAAASVFALSTAVAQADNYGTTRAQAQANARLVYTAFRPYGDAVARCMVRVMYRESGGNPRAANYHDSNGGSYGLLQLNGVHRWRGETMSQFVARMWNPATHIQAAVRLYRGSGISPWRSCG